MFFELDWHLNGEMILMVTGFYSVFLQETKVCKDQKVA